MKLGVTILICLLGVAAMAVAGEVGKGQIPNDHLAASMKTLPWGVQVWDVDEAVKAMNSQAKILWVDTRPTSFFKQGTVKEAVLLVYNQTGAEYPDGEPVCTKESLSKAMAAAEADMVVFFCQGPKCHRSYNAAYVAVQEWGLDPANVVWFRAGYPDLFKAVGDNAKLKRKAPKYLSEAALSKF